VAAAVGQVALAAAVAPVALAAAAGQVAFPNALASIHHGVLGAQAPIQIHEDVGLSNILDTIHDHPNNHEPMTNQDLALELLPNG